MGGDDTRAAGSVTATPQALELIERLRAEHGPVVFLQSAGCCGGSDPTCIRADMLLTSPGDLLLGAIGGADFWIERELFERWNRPDLVIDVVDEASDTFSLEGLVGKRFILAPPTRFDLDALRAYVAEHDATP
jgi:uncharacterized protein (DUF779 family)